MRHLLAQWLRKAANRVEPPRPYEAWIDGRQIAGAILREGSA
jgi:hypothetical protein